MTPTKVDNRGWWKWLLLAAAVVVLLIKSGLVAGIPW